MRFFTLLLLLFTVNVMAQNAVTGVVLDSKSNEPLPFATVIPEKGAAIATDVDGKFLLRDTNGSSYLSISYTGYNSQKITLTKSRHYVVKLVSHTRELQDLVIESENPANVIIREAVRRKPENDPLKKLNSFRYKTYERLTVTANPDSISDKLDSLYIYEKTGRRFAKIDSTDFKFRQLIEKRHLYQTEKISEFNFNKEQGLKENILATRMAGFKEPVYEIIALKLQPYSVYEDIDLVESKYEGPLSRENARYRYKILDTVSIQNRTAFAIFFTPKRKSKKFRLEGILYIDTTTYGVAKAVFRVKNVLDVTATHNFKYVENEQLWFPESRNLKIVKGNNERDIKILGEKITFDATEEEAQNRKREPSDYVYLLSESKNTDIEFNIPLTIKHSAVAVEIEEAAINRPESYWDRFRSDTLDLRSAETYPALDSIVDRENYERLIILGKNILNGYVPLGPVNLDWRQVVRYNVHEGFRLGLGGTTNAKFSEIFRITGYGAYGTKDGKFKYSLGGAVRIGKFSNTWIGGSYTDDLQEIGSIRFETDRRRFRIYDSRPLNISTFYNYQSWEGYIESRKLAKTDARLEMARTRIDPLFDYIFMHDGHPYHIFNITTATAAIQWNPFSDYMQTPSGRIETEKRFPKFTFQYTQSLENLLDSDFTFAKLDFRTEYEKKYLNGQKTALLLQTGIAIGDTPLTHLYSLMPNSRDKSTIVGRLRFAGKNSFETMYFNEFFSSQYVIFQAKHALRKYNLFGKINMSPVLVTRFAWGNMEDKQDHQGIEFNTLEKGYYESGIELNNIWQIIGITGFYRYGPYHLPEFTKNIAVKISITINLL
jgi:hypothetical protein